MMKPLRKRHLQIWTAWAVLLPVIIIAGYMAVPKKITGELLQKDTSSALPVVINSVSRNNYVVSLRTKNDKSQIQLEWINTAISSIPSTLIYREAKPENELLGRIEAKGTYYFPLKIDSTGNYNFILYDIIHKQVIDSIKFKQ
ncbi:MAG: hypothetical protein ACM3H8_09620 [Sphingobacteriales bacterium]